MHSSTTNGCRFIQTKGKGRSMSTETQTATNTKTKTKTFGGVSAAQNKGALFGESPGPSELQTVAPTAAAHTNFVYHGGPVIGCSQVYATFWGDQWLTDPTST